VDEDAKDVVISIGYRITKKQDPRRFAEIRNARSTSIFSSKELASCAFAALIFALPKAYL
jgi:hypothetical protein